MVFDHAFVSTGYEDKMLDAGLAGFIDGILNQGAIDHRQHFFWQGLGGGQESGSEAGYREYCRSDALGQIVNSMLRSA
jgi:hypothetical protein